jgi:hypothetical protein
VPVRAALAGLLLLLAADARAQGEQGDPCDQCREAPPPLPPVVDPPPPPPPFQLVTPAPRPRPDVLFRYELGPTYTRALERNLGGARLDIEVGADLRHVTIGGRAGAEVGGTQSGLPYERLSWGVGIDGKLGPVRLGIEPRVGVLFVNRATERNPLEDLFAPSLGLHGECIVALIGAGAPSTRSHTALDLIVRVGYDWIDVVNGRLDAANTISAKLGLGGRY